MKRVAPRGPERVNGGSPGGPVQKGGKDLPSPPPLPPHHPPPPSNGLREGAKPVPRVQSAPAGGANNKASSAAKPLKAADIEEGEVSAGEYVGELRQRALASLLARRSASAAAVKVDPAAPPLPR